MNAQEALLHWLKRRLEPADHSWLWECCQRLAEGVPDRVLYLTFSQAVRHVGKRPLAVDLVEQGEAFSIHPGWDLSDWTCDQAARASILLSIPSGSGAVAAILALHQTADLGEHLAVVRCLFLLPDAKGLLHIAREAIRSNIRDVFAAISQRNPYPAGHCDEIAWNQMVVKCLFVDLPLRSIYGLDRRANKELRRILVDLWLERTAARRPFSSEAWRCVGPFADEKAMSAMETALNGPLPESRGAALGLWSAPEEKGRAVLKVKAPELIGALQAGILNWENYDA
jgi:hypothetical protein